MRKRRFMTRAQYYNWGLFQSTSTYLLKGQKTTFLNTFLNKVTAIVFTIILAIFVYFFIITSIKIVANNLV